MRLACKCHKSLLPTGTVSVSARSRSPLLALLVDTTPRGPASELCFLPASILCILQSGSTFSMRKIMCHAFGDLTPISGSVPSSVCIIVLARTLPDVAFFNVNAPTLLPPAPPPLLGQPFLAPEMQGSSGACKNSCSGMRESSICGSRCLPLPGCQLHKIFQLSSHRTHLST